MIKEKSRPTQVIEKDCPVMIKGKKPSDAGHRKRQPGPDERKRFKNNENPGYCKYNA